MANLTMKVKGKKGINWHVARHRSAQRALGKEANAGAAKAQAQLAAHVHDGHSAITMSRGKSQVDWWVTLNDERGQSAAMTIEYGRKGGTTGSDGREVAPMAPVKPLRTGFPALDRG